MTLYFAYGSNMNPARMSARGCSFNDRRPATLRDYRLRFNKRAYGKTGVGYANIDWCVGDEVQGVVYELTGIDQLDILDPFEGTPVRYSRDLMPLHTHLGCEFAWVYFANPAWIDHSVAPEARYLQHLLHEAAPLSADYRARLEAVASIPDTGDYDPELALRFND